MPILPRFASVLAAAALLASCTAVSEIIEVDAATGVDSGGGGRPGGGGGGGASDSGPHDAAQDDDTSNADATEADTATDNGSDGAPHPVDIGGGDDTGAPDVAADVDDEPEVSVDDDCEQISAIAERTFAPVDIIWVIDTSGSMGEEAALIQREIANFVSYFDAVDLDWRVVMIATAEDGGTIDVCVPPPLSSVDTCPDADSDRYRRVRSFVASNNAFEVIDANWDGFSSFLRPDAVTHFVLVSDDESERNRTWFEDRMRPRLPGGFVFHSIVSLTEECIFFGLDCWGCEGPHGDAEARGSQYIALSTATGGVAASICDASWTPIFDQIAEGVLTGAGLSCEYLIPEAPFGEIFYDSVRVEFVAADGVTRRALDRVPSAADCTGGQQWYYDNNETPTTVYLCPSACGDIDGAIEIFFDCVKA